MHKTTSTILATAVAGLLLGSSSACRSSADSSVAAPDPVTGEKHACAGMNSCQGKGGCTKGDNRCAGKNSCAGKGGCATVDHHTCAGKNECKQQGGCKSSANGCAGKNDCKAKGGCAVPIERR